jgi:hypothetical protein
MGASVSYVDSKFVSALTKITFFPEFVPQQGLLLVL